MISWFSKQADVRNVLLLDIGSGSVGASLVANNEDEQPHIVWQHREFVLLREVHSEVTEKMLHTALLNALLETTSAGLPVLQQATGSTRLNKIQVVVTAPLCYTVARTVTYENDEVFLVTQALLDELTEKAEAQMEEQFTELGLEKQAMTLAGSAVLHTALNDYQVTEVVGQTTNKLELNQLQAFVTSKLEAAIKENLEKLFPEVPHTINSAMVQYYCYATRAHSHIKDAVLLDIGYEGTEIGVIRDGALVHVTHAHSGVYTVARQLANKIKTPLEEAYAYLQSSKSALAAAEQQGALNEVNGMYETVLLELLTKAGDSLGIPNTFFIHTTTDTETYFTARTRATGVNLGLSNIAPIAVTHELLTDAGVTDTMSLLSLAYWQYDENCERCN